MTLEVSEASGAKTLQTGTLKVQPPRHYKRSDYFPSQNSAQKLFLDRFPFHVTDILLESGYPVQTFTWGVT